MPLTIIHGDITEMKVDAIVNSANLFYSKGGGVCKAIHDKAGFELTEYCFKLETGKYCDVKVTPGFNLITKNIIHVITPKYQHDKEGVYLKKTIHNMIGFVKENHYKQVALPLLGAGHNGYPEDMALSIIRECLEKEDIDFILVLREAN